MDAPQFPPNDPQPDATSERHRQAAAESPASKARHVIARLVIWLLLALGAAWAWLGVYAQGMTSMFNTSPTPESEYRSLEVMATVLFLLSLAPLFWPKAPWGLMVFGVLWALVGLGMLSDFW